MSDPTLFRTEVITKLTQTVDDVKSIAEQALELAQNGGGGTGGGGGTSGTDEAYDAADEVREADDEVVQNLLNYDEYNFMETIQNSELTYFKVNTCKARKYQNGLMRFFLTITTKTFPAVGVSQGIAVETLVRNTYLSSNGATIALKVMGGVEWVYIHQENGLVCDLNAFAQCSPNEQYTIACELELYDADRVVIGSHVPKETIEVSMPDGATPYDYIYDITTEVNNLQSQTQTNITFTSVRMTIRNYDRYYVHFSYSGTFNSDRKATTSAQALTSDYITATAELYPSTSSCGGYTNFLPYIYPTLGLQFINEEAVSEGQEFLTHATIICPLSATMTINTSNLKQLESNGGKLKTTSAGSVQSSLVKYKLVDLGGGSWNGSVNFIQDQLGVFVVLSVGTDGDSEARYGSLSNGLSNVFIPVSLNTQLEVYKLIKARGKYVLGVNGEWTLSLYEDHDYNRGLRLELLPDRQTIVDNKKFEHFGFCIHGLIPGAYLHTEDQPPTPPPNPGDLS